jgi:(p)ppGpp synthase/HD superfamily hydrolase
MQSGGMVMWDQEKYQKAIGFAHRNQMVPGKEYTYVVHLSNVAAEIARVIMAEHLDDEDLAIQCALLHDTLEDTEVRPEELESAFGKNALNGVLALTKNKGLDNANRMKDSLKRINNRAAELGPPVRRGMLFS